MQIVDESFMIFFSFRLSNLSNTSSREKCTFFPFYSSLSPRHGIIVRGKHMYIHTSQCDAVLTPTSTVKGRFVNSKHRSAFKWEWFRLSGRAAYPLANTKVYFTKFDDPGTLVGEWRGDLMSLFTRTHTTRADYGGIQKQNGSQKEKTIGERAMSQSEAHTGSPPLGAPTKPPP